MQKYRTPGITIVTIVFLGAGLFTLLEFTKTREQIPNLSPRSGEAAASSEFLNAERAVEYFRDAFRRDPTVVKNYVVLAQLFLRESRVTGNDLEYVTKAQYLLEEALRRDPENFDAIVTKASMLMSMHHFEEAKEFAEKAIARNPYNAFAYGVLCDALVEMGEYEEAVKACGRMLSIRPDLRSYARASYLRELHGDLHGAREAMKLAANAGVFGHENRAWALYNLGTLYLNEGKLDIAAYVFQGILEERPNYAYGLGGLAEVNSRRGDYAEAIELVETAYEVIPSHHFLEELANIYRASGQMEKARSTAVRALEAMQQDEQRGWHIDQEYAIFCADQELNLREALKRAQSAYERRPNNIDVLETYAWVLYKNGKAVEAVPYIERAMRLNTQNSTLHYRAGMIYCAAGQEEEALAHLERSLNLNPSVNAYRLEGARKMSSILKDISFTASRVR
ncbi:MAG: tetratricopeptide repeat protein [Bacteroidota bacterium]